MRPIRYFSYSPSTPLIFQDGKCELCHDKALYSIYSAFAFNKIAAPATVLFAVGSFSSSIFLNFFATMAPLWIYGMIFLPATHFGVKQMYLTEDGKSLIFNTISDRNTFRTVKIKEIALMGDEESFIDDKLYYKPFQTSDKDDFFLMSKVADFYYKDVVEKVIEGIEIEVGENKG